MYHRERDKIAGTRYIRIDISSVNLVSCSTISLYAFPIEDYGKDRPPIFNSSFNPDSGRLCGRSLYDSGRENVYPREIEEILYQHPAVHEAAVFAIPDDYWVEKVHAAIVLKPEASTTEKDIIEFCKQRLARYKAPKSVEFVAGLPKSPAGKILNRELRGKYWAGTERKV